MDTELACICYLPLLLALAWLLPLASFVLILLFGPRMGRAGTTPLRGHGRHRRSCVLSFAALVLVAVPSSAGRARRHCSAAPRPSAAIGTRWASSAAAADIGYYIDSLTVAMFCMVTLVASCIHVYSIGYMHGELSDVIDTLARWPTASRCAAAAAIYRFFQYLSLFCFSMLGLVIAGNLAMVFMFWELVGICSYLLIGFWHERRASNAANKAFIVNRVGDFGMIIGLMAIWAGMGTFSFGDYRSRRQMDRSRRCPASSAKFGRRKTTISCSARRNGEAGRAICADRATIVRCRRARQSVGKVHERLDQGDTPMSWLRRSSAIGARKATAIGLLVLAGLGIFCGCVGKSASSRCTSGCPTRWKARRRSAP